LAASPDFCWPATGLAPSGDRLGAEIDQAIEVAFDAEGSPGRRHHATPRVAVAAGATGYGVVLPLWCMTAHHAQRAAAIIHRRHRRQLAQLRGILADHAARRTARTPMTAVSKTSSSSISALSANGVLR